MASNFEKYLLCEQHFSSKSKKGVIKTVEGFLESFKRKSMSSIRDTLEHIDRVSNYDTVGDAIEKELGRLNNEYVDKITEYINGRKWD